MSKHSTFKNRYLKEMREHVIDVTGDNTWWVFVWNNPTDLQAPSKLKDLIEVWWQYEEGAVKHRPHLQGVAHFAFPKSRVQLREQIPGWWQLRYGTVEQAVRYCTKDKGRLDGPWHIALAVPYLMSLDAILAEPATPRRPKPVGYELQIGPLPQEQRERYYIEQDKPFGEGFYRHQ